MVMREIVCPFCGCKNVASKNVNVICTCGAKYYIHNGEFWNRKNGNIVKNAPYRLIELEENNV